MPYSVDSTCVFINLTFLSCFFFILNNSETLLQDLRAGSILGFEDAPGSYDLVLILAFVECYNREHKQIIWKT